MLAVKRIFRYLKETMNCGLWYPKNQNFQLSVYLDVDWDNYMDERKSASGGVFLLGDSPVAWLTKNKGSIYNVSDKSVLFPAVSGMPVFDRPGDNVTADTTPVGRELTTKAGKRLELSQ